MKQKKVALIFSYQGLSILGLGMELETVETLQAEGWEVHVVTCDNRACSCFFNPTHNLAGCAVCESRATTFFSRAGLPPERHHRLLTFAEAEEAEFPHFYETDDLLQYEYDGINIGRGALSSAVSLTRSNIMTSDTYGELIELQLKTALQALFNGRHYLDELQPERVYFYNGRFAEVYPLIELCEERDITFYTLEMENSLDRYNAFENTLPHSLKAYHSLMEEKWAGAPSPQREEEARAWYEARRAGSQTTDPVHTGMQQKGTLPEGFDAKVHNVALFNSSEDEMVSIREWDNSMFNNQNHAIRSIAEEFAGRRDIHFYLRVHPNLAKVDNPQVQGIAAMDYPNLTVIPATSPVDTYRLIDACDKVIVFGSTVGVEATFWGATSILIGRAFYDNRDCIYRPADRESLYQLIADKNLPPKPQEETYPYGYFVPNRGTPYKKLRWGGKANTFYGPWKMGRVMPDTWKYALRYAPRIARWLTNSRIINGRLPNVSDLTKLKGENKLPESL